MQRGCTTNLSGHGKSGKSYKESELPITCHPEFISGSQTMLRSEIPKQVRDDREAGSG